MIRIYPPPTLYDDAIALVKSDTTVDTSGFFLRRSYHVPWSSIPTTFILETDQPEAVHTITVNRDTVYSTVPGAAITNIQLLLEKGANRIDVSAGDDGGGVHVAATAVETWFRALGREFYLAVSMRLDAMEQQLKHPWTTRISGHLLPFGDLFLPSSAPRMHQTRLAIITAMGGRQGHGDGVMQMASALYYCTPHVTKNRDSEFMVPGRDWLLAGMSSHATQGELNGRMFDVWTPNACLAHKSALVRLVSNLRSPDLAEPPSLTLDDVGDEQVLLQNRDGQTEVHRLNTSDASCVTIDQTCDATDRVFLETQEVVEMTFLSPQVPFDRVVTKPLHFGFFDSGFNWDESTGTGLPGIGGDDHLDNVDEHDIYGTGFRDVGLSRRFDYACLDTMDASGRRVAKFTFPLDTTQPEDDVGMPLLADVDVGAPSGAPGTTVLWATSAQPWFAHGDWVRIKEQGVDLFLVSVWPVLGSVNKSGPVTVAATDGGHIVTAPAGFFEPRHAGCGIQFTTQKACIVRVSTDGTTAYITGNATLPVGAVDAEVYLPLRDRHSTTMPGYSGHRVFELTFGDPLVGSQVLTGDGLDRRYAPRVVGSFASGAEYIEVMSDIPMQPNDRLFITDTSYLVVAGTVLLGTHALLNLPIYGVDLAAPAGSSFTNGQSLYCVRAMSCFVEGDPVTPLSTSYLAPADYIMPLSPGVMYRAAGAPYASLGDATIPVPLPAGSDGDLMVMCFSVRGAVVITPPVGWTLVGGGGTSFLKFNVFTKVRTNLDISPVNVTTSASASQTTVAQIFSFINASSVTAGTPTAVSGVTSTIGPIPGVTAPPSTYVLAMGCGSNDWNSITSLSGDGLTWQQIGNAATSVGGDAGQVVDIAPVASATTVTAKSWTASPEQFGIQGGQMFVINP